MAVITKSELANNLRTQYGLTMTDSCKIVDIIFNEIKDSLLNNEQVKITGFGTFKILDKTARIGRNPKTGIPALISARKVASFKPCTEFRKLVSTNK
ncbi:MAG: integration host factor subunit alpha [Alphaproteobacteria bacterium]|nr:integration host factor subunit alpha [Alphaproteobacteria bacterium]